MIDEFFNYFGVQAGVLIVIGVGLLLFFFIAFVLERRTRLLFPDRKKSDDDFELFDFDGDEEKDE